MNILTVVIIVLVVIVFIITLVAVRVKKSSDKDELAYREAMRRLKDQYGRSEDLSKDFEKLKSKVNWKK